MVSKRRTPQEQVRVFCRRKRQATAANSIIKESTVLFRAACPYPPYWGAYPDRIMKTKLYVYFLTGDYNKKPPAKDFLCEDMKRGHPQV